MEDVVAELVEKALETRPNLFLISLEVTPENSIRVIIDGDDGVSVQDCIDMSRAIEHNLDREEQDFSLEVLSAGATEPLQLKRQYKKNVGRELKLKTEADTFKGTLTEMDDETVTIQWKTREPKPVGKGKHTVQKEVKVPYEDIVEAKVLIKFK